MAEMRRHGNANGSTQRHVDGVDADPARKIHEAVRDVPEPERGPGMTRAPSNSPASKAFWASAS